MNLTGWHPAIYGAAGIVMSMTALEANITKRYSQLFLNYYRNRYALVRPGGLAIRANATTNKFLAINSD